MHTNRRVALLFPGQGSQYPAMGAGLYGRAGTFTAVMDEAFEGLGDVGRTLRAEWLSGGTTASDDVTRAQPLLYAVGYALGRTLLDGGLDPVAMLGHSVGEMIAATLAGVITFPDGVRLMRDRITHYAATPAGGMLAVAASVAELEPFLTGDVAVAAVNAPQQTLVAGRRADLVALTVALHAAGYVCRHAAAEQAFHSPVVADAAERTLDGWAAARPGPPRRALYSAHREAVLDDATAADPGFWARQPATTVWFWPTLCRMLGDVGDVLLVEVGPGRGLGTIARRHPAVASGGSDVVATLPDRPSGPDAEQECLRAAVRRIAAEGHRLADDVALVR